MTGLVGVGERRVCVRRRRRRSLRGGQAERVGSSRPRSRRARGGQGEMVSLRGTAVAVGWRDGYEDTQAAAGQSTGLQLCTEDAVGIRALFFFFRIGRTWSAKGERMGREVLCAVWRLWEHDPRQRIRGRGRRRDADAGQSRDRRGPPRAGCAIGCARLSPFRPPAQPGADPAHRQGPRSRTLPRALAAACFLFAISGCAHRQHLQNPDPSQSSSEHALRPLLLVHDTPRRCLPISFRGRSQHTPSCTT